MLCRALIAAVAVTCTLSHGQATPRLDRIKDLMCVLLLSGMQKEDLDVSMLTKLQRHNVNIEDMNNEQLIEACVQSRDNNSNYEVTNIKETQPNNKIKNAFQKYFKTTGDTEVSKRSHTTENVSYNGSAVYKSRNKFHENDNKATKKKSYYENYTNVDEVTQDNDRRPKLERLWHDMIINKVNETLIIEPYSITVQESKRSISENKHLSKINTLNGLLANYLASSVSTIQTTTKKTINIDDIVEKLYSMRIQDMEKNTNGNSRFKHPFTYLADQQNAPKSPILKELETKREEPNIMNHTNPSNAFILLNTFKSFNPFIPDAEVVSNHYRKTKESLNWSRNPYGNSFQSADTTSASTIEPKQKISRDMIKEIADSVKEIILRDLRKELHETTTVTTSTTIMSTTTIQSTTKRESDFQTTFHKENSKKQDSVMNKLLELFEELKSLKQNTIVIKSETEKGMNNKNPIEKVDFKEVNVYPYRSMPAIKPNNIIQTKLPFPTNQVYGIKEYPTENSENIFNFAPQIHKYRSNGTIISQPTIKKQPTIIEQKPNNGLLPLTVQTNNIEIPPLGIPLDKSQNLIRQNIIVTTKVPYRIAPIKNGKIGPSKKEYQHRGSPHLEASETFETYKLKHMNPRLSNEARIPHLHNFHPKDNDDVIRFTLNNNEHSKYNANYYEKINLGKYKPHPNRDEIIHREIPRFHEKLEKIERYLDYPEQSEYTDRNDCCNEKLGYSKARVDCCNRKIASRQQMSLNNMKKKSYDDGHFKKFLQSQQKVTDMLERILGDKGNVHSVETV